MKIEEAQTVASPPQKEHTHPKEASRGALSLKISPTIVVRTQTILKMLFFKQATYFFVKGLLFILLLLPILEGCGLYITTFRYKDATVYFRKRKINQC